MNDIQKDKSKAWIIKIKEEGNLIFGEITSECRVDKNVVKHLAEGDVIEEYDRIERLIKEAIVAITPNQDIILNTRGHVFYEVIYLRNWFIRIIDEFIIGMYETVVIDTLNAIFQIKNIRFINHRNKLIRYNNRENNKAFLKEIKDDNISILKDDEEGGYYIKLKKSQLHKYLFNDLFGSKVEIVAVPLAPDHLLTESDLNTLAQPGINFHLDPEWMSLINSIMQDHKIIGTYIEDVYYFVAQKQVKDQIINQLDNLAKKKSIAISWEN